MDFNNSATEELVHGETESETEVVRGPRKQRKKMTIAQKDAALGYVLVLIPLVAFVIFNAFPMVISFALMFCDIDYDYNISSMAWNSFASFKAVFSDSKIWISLRVSLFCVLAQFTSLVIALFTANMLAKKHRGKRHKGATFFEVLFFIPHICSMVALSVIWKWMFDVDQGIINDVLTRIGLSPVNWYQDEAAYPWMIFIVIVWSSPGYGIIMYKSVFSTINPSLYEAADIDGASEMQKFWKITFPELASMTFYLLMLAIIAGMQTFEIAKVIVVDEKNQGVAGPHNSGLTMMLYIYQKYENFQLSQSAVISWFLFAITFFISMINNKIKKKWVDE